MGALRTLRRDKRGATIVEFALVSPVMILMMMGLGDLGYQVYAQSILNGAMQKAGRDSAIQGGANATATIDGKVTAMMSTIAKNATIDFTRRSYSTFSSISKPEPFDDINRNGRRDAGECYTDMNSNKAWDAAPDPGTDGQGGGNDVTVYTATVTYPHLFPVARLLGWPANQTITATTLLKNQPFAVQKIVSICT